MVLDDLGTSLRSSLDKLQGKSRLSESDVEEIVKEIQRSLLSADVDVSLVMELSDSIKSRALEEEPPGGTTAKDHVLKIVYEEMVELVGDSTELPLENQTILLAGLQGSGKTTSAAKMAWWFSKKGLRPAVIQTDTFRPGAYDQAKQMCERAEVDFYGNPDNDDPVDIARTGLEETEDADVHIVDTAGRHALEDDLIAEIEEIEGVVDPDRSLLVLDAAIGQGAKDQARQFEKSIGIEGVVITKLDGTAKGGGALTAVNETDSSIAFLGTGETVQDIERFEPSGFISRLLGMGDLKQLSERVERAMQETQEEDGDWDPEDMLQGEFTLKDMKRQMDAMNKMGPLDQVMDMIPGLGGGMMDELPDDAMDVTQDRMRRFERIMDSMTEEELENPRVVGQSRVERIARGSGTDEETVQQLLEQHSMMEETIGQFQGMGEGDMQRMMKKMGGEGGGLGDMMGGGKGPF
ncbi:signal recognition particle protein Srp54 [Halorubrum distributum JCM 9100]|uniref:Signal recognition particle 54 kDa protein n=5 Tax=Halorubrum distributum TaxID=29283 RepID=M0F438_9EURY|nr:MULTISPECIES: signal recognition particle protein Srp54 [Halorubrum distributum group]PHQ44505.1 signal recognition particle protein [Halorubrum sp. C3]ELZ34289.1 signal recognition particle protein Srp54 [Halorubrum terrestre JCM 10247]ELZ54123.1 signal recognition particle protein Srp54 [Halorubrum distributum JCM 9100]ELZ54461.1 signal recognition particle protein Srp54 [Halorubrum distributum JCM 10118]EMA71461.1 signal recognition particle protein Srp54 [Halorubrum arcis JCM 13916]